MNRSYWYQRKAKGEGVSIKGKLDWAYASLHLRQGAPVEVVKAAAKALKRKHHPDNGEYASRTLFEQSVEAELQLLNHLEHESA
jgi:DnaJ-class molecular chaperone